MIRVTGKYAKQSIVLDRPLDVPEGKHLEIWIPETDQEREDWNAVGMSRLEKEWDCPEDAIYDDWKKHYGL